MILVDYHIWKTDCLNLMINGYKSVVNECEVDIMGLSMNE